MYPQQYPQGSNIPLLPNQRTYSLPQNKQPATYIDLTKKQKVGVSNLVSHQEKIYFAGVVSKVNKRGVPQNRIIVITNKFLYNIDAEGGVFSFLCSPSGSYSLQRKIAIQKIFGATVSVNPTSELQQFVIHVQGEYDYRFNGGQKREKFLRSLMNAHFANSSQPFVLYCQNEANLFRFHTTDDDFYAKVNKRPKQGQILVTPDMAENGIEWIIFNRHNFAGRPNTARPVPTSTNQPQLPAPLYLPPSNNFHGAFPQNPGYPLMLHTPQWGNPMPFGYPGPMNERPSYYVPEAQPQFSPPHVSMNVHQQYTQNQTSVQPKEVRQVNKENNEVMTMQAKRQSSGPNDWSFIQRNIVPYNSSPNANVQIHTNFDYFYQNGQQNATLNHYNGYNNAQNPNFRAPNM